MGCNDDDSSSLSECGMDSVERECYSSLNYLAGLTDLGMNAVRVGR